MDIDTATIGEQHALGVVVDVSGEDDNDADADLRRASKQAGSKQASK